MESVMEVAVIYLVRHGETEWSRSRRHTGTTDLGLTARGITQAESLAAPLKRISAETVMTSPLERARDTCRLAGLDRNMIVDERLAEWDYGFAEGRTTADLRTEEAADWSVWTHPIRGGEAIDDVAARVDSLIAEIRDRAEVTILFGHAHLFRILGARWCGLPPTAGQHLVLDPASVSVLGFERESPTIIRWNLTGGLDGEGET